jgi:flagellar protein FlbD
MGGFNGRFLFVIAVTRLNKQPFVVNAELIKIIESTPDTMITLINGERFIVRETLQDVVDRAIEYSQKIRCFNVV